MSENQEEPSGFFHGDNLPERGFYRIMIVDDELDLDLWERAVLIVPDSLFIPSMSGLTALQMLDKYNYALDAVVIDLSMPDKDGLSVTKEIREQEQDIRSKTHPIKLFWCTGTDIQDDPTLSEAFRKYDVTAVLMKPITPDEVIRKVKDYLQ